MNIHDASHLLLLANGFSVPKFLYVLRCAACRDVIETISSETRVLNVTLDDEEWTLATLMPVNNEGFNGITMLAVTINSVLSAFVSRWTTLHAPGVVTVAGLNGCRFSPCRYRRLYDLCKSLTFHWHHSSSTDPMEHTSNGDRSRKFDVYRT